jgi:CRP-like cAMP-binding protein
MTKTISHDILRIFTPFDTLNPEYLDKVTEKASVREFPKGTMVFKRGKELEEAFYLIEGHVDLIDAQFVITSVDPRSESRRLPLSGSSPTQVSAMTKSPVKLLCVERDFLDLVMAWSESGEDPSTVSEDDNDWMSYLLQAPLFAKIPPGNIRQLFSRFTEQKVTADEVVVKEGERGELFYVLKTGSATVVDTSGKILAALRPGDYFGEEALVGDTTRNATVKMLTPGKLMCLQKEDFKALLHEPVTRFITAEELRERQKEIPPYQLLDVRLAVERRFQHVPGSRNIPLGSLRRTLAELDSQMTYLVTDDAGRRSDVAAQLLNQAGFDTYILKHADQHYSGL